MNISNKKIFNLVFINSLPSLFIMFLTGLYAFFDDVLSINFADDSYSAIHTSSGIMYSSQEIIRLSLSLALNMTYALEAIALLFAIGSSVKYSHLIGQERFDEAKSFIQTSFKVNVIASMAIVPIMLSVINPWLDYQYHSDPWLKEAVLKTAWDYVWIVTISLPFLMFMQYVTALARAKQRNLIASFIIGLPLLINLLLDYILMGVADLGVDGGAWATFMSYVFGSILSTIWLFSSSDSDLNLKLMLKFEQIRFTWILWILLIGASPFLRNFGQSLTESIESHKINDVSTIVYHKEHHAAMMSYYTNVLPIYNIIFPIIFGYIHSISPLVSNMKGKGEIFKIRKVAWQVFIQSTVASLFIYVGLILIRDDLFKLMRINNIKNDTIGKEKNILSIIALSIPLYTPVLTGLVIFTGTQNYKSAIFISLLRSFILIWPFIILFSLASRFAGDSHINFYETGKMTHPQYTFWWYYPTVSALSSIIATVPLMYTYGRRKWCIDKINKIKVA